MIWVLCVLAATILLGVGWAAGYVVGHAEGCQDTYDAIDAYQNGRRCER